MTRERFQRLSLRGSSQQGKSTTYKRGGARAEEELLGPGATRERFRGAGDAGESGGRGGVGRTRGSRADAKESGGRGGRPVSVSGAEEICFSNREAEAESQWILAARRVYHLQHLAS